MKLISMTDYVLEEHKNYDGIETTQNNFDNIRILALNRIINYANFLKQPLKLGMFVPCDENDMPLDEPKANNYNMQSDVAYDLFNENIMEYKQAKERVLFKNCKIETPEQHGIINLSESILLICDDEVLAHKKSWENEFEFYSETIEDLTLCEDILELTDSAIKKHKL